MELPCPMKLHHQTEQSPLKALEVLFRMSGWSPPPASETKGPSVATASAFSLPFSSFAALLRDCARARHEKERKAVLAQFALARRTLHRRLEYLNLREEEENNELEGLIERGQLEYAVGLAQFAEVCSCLLDAQSLLALLSREKEELEAACLQLASLRYKFLQLELQLRETEEDVAADELLDCATATALNAEMAGNHADSVAQRCLRTAEKTGDILFVSYLKLAAAPHGVPWFAEKNSKYIAHWEGLNSRLLQILADAIDLTTRCQAIEVDCTYIRGRILPPEENEGETACFFVPPAAQKGNERLRGPCCYCCAEGAPKRSPEGPLSHNADAKAVTPEDADSEIGETEELREAKESRKRASSLNEEKEEGEERATKRICCHA